MREKAISTMRLNFAFAYTETGKPIGPVLNLPINPRAKDDDVFFVANTLGSLQGLELHSVHRMDSCDLRGAES